MYKWDTFVSCVLCSPIICLSLCCILLIYKISHIYFLKFKELYHTKWIKFANLPCKSQVGLKVVGHTITAKKKKHFSLRISSVNMTKSAFSCRLGHIYWRNPLKENSSFCVAYTFYHNGWLENKFLLSKITKIWVPFSRFL